MLGSPRSGCPVEASGEGPLGGSQPVPPHCVLMCWLHKYPLPTTSPNSRLQRGKQVFSLNHTVYTSGQNMEGHAYKLGKVEDAQNPSSRCQPRATLASRSFIRQQSGACPVILFSAVPQSDSDISKVKHHLLSHSLLTLEPCSALFTINTQHISLHTLLMPDTHSAPCTLC